MAESKRKYRRLSEQELIDLPPTVDIPTAGRAYGWGATKSRDLVRSGDFPVEVLTRGRSRIVTKPALLTALGYDWDAVVGWHPATGSAKPDAA